MNAVTNHSVLATGYQIDYLKLIHLLKLLIKIHTRTRSAPYNNR
jgi:hypothetical protein